VDIERYSRCCGAGSLERGSCLSSEHEPRKGFVYAKQTSQGECFARRKPRKRDCARMWGVERRRAARKFSEETVRFAASQEVVDRRARSADLESGLRLRSGSRRDCGISDLESGSSFSQSSVGIAWCSASLGGCSISVAQISKGIGENGVKSPKSDRDVARISKEICVRSANPKKGSWCQGRPRKGLVRSNASSRIRDGA
jgi:hypothetical protein